MPSLVQSFDAISWQRLESLARRPLLASLFLLALVACCALPGILTLPAVDRTEAVFAGSARQLAEEGSWQKLEPARQRKPAAAVWLQALPAKVGLPSDAISSYRVPSLLLTAFGVWLIFHLGRPVIGAPAALIAAALVGVTPIVVLHAHMAIAEPLVFPAMVAAQFSLLRLYARPQGDDTASLAVLFWMAQAASIPFNALCVPLVSAATLAALCPWDRRVGWLRALRVWPGLAACSIATALWLVADAAAYGEATLPGKNWRETLSMLAGSQQMNFPAYPGLFMAFLLLGFVPAHLFLVPVLLRHKTAAAMPATRFLLAWLGGYLVYLELFSDKPALYVVQNLFPPAAGLVAIALLQPSRVRDPLGVGLPVAGLAATAGLMMAPAATYALHRLTGSDVPLATLVLGGAVSVLLVLAVWAARRWMAAAWLVLGIAGTAMLNVLAFSVVLPNVGSFWVSRELAATLATLEGCPNGPVAVIGFREPSLVFTPGRRISPIWPIEAAETSTTRGTMLLIVEQRWEGQVHEAFALKSPQALRRVACAAGINVARGCRLAFSFYVAESPGQTSTCQSRLADRCPPPAAAPARDYGRDCL